MDDLVVIEVRSPHLTLGEFLLLAIFLAFSSAFSSGSSGTYSDRNFASLSEIVCRAFRSTNLRICSSSFLNLGSALRRSTRALFEHRDEIAGNAVVVVVRQIADLVELEGVVHLPFAKVSLIIHRGDMNVRRDALDLRAFTVSPVELLDRQFEGPRLG